MVIIRPQSRLALATYNFMGKKNGGDPNHLLAGMILQVRIEVGPREGNSPNQSYDMGMGLDPSIPIQGRVWILRDTTKYTT